MVYSFEEGIPEGITAAGSRVRTDGEHHKDGKQSLLWEADGDASLILKGPVGYRHFREGGLNQDRHCFVIWLYREEEQEEPLRFSFYKEGRERCHFYFGQRFRGWRTCWVPYRDMEGAPEEGMDEIRVERRGRGRSRIRMDRLITSVPIDPRHPVPDLQVPFVNPSVDRAVNAHWTSLLRFSRLEEQCRKESEGVVTENDINVGKSAEAGIRLMEKRLDEYYLGIYRSNAVGATGADREKPAEEECKALWKRYEGLGLRRESDGMYSGVTVEAVYHKAAYPKEAASELEKLTGAADIQECCELLLKAAYVWHDGDEAQREKAARHYMELLRHLWEQGWAYGSSLGTTHHLGYPMRKLYPAVFLMREPLKRAGLLGEAARMTDWFSGMGRIFLPAEELRGESTDTLNTLLQGILCSCLLQEERRHKIRCLKALSRWLSAVLKPAPGLEGPYKADGSAFHHAGHYPAYAVGGFQGAAPVIWALSGTCFAVEEEARKTMRNSLLHMRIYCNRYHWPVSMSARHPKGVGEMSGITDLTPFYYMALAGEPGARPGEEGEQPGDAEMAGALLRLAEYKDFPPAEELRRRGYQAEKSPEGHFSMNYACAGIHRRGELMACVRGHSRYLWGNETYEKNNLYGRYITYGSLQILGSGTPVNNEDSGFRQEGWDWNYFPGTTATVLPWEELRQRVCVVDATAGFEEMLLSDEAFAGSLTFEGRQGCFGMKLHGHGKYDGSLRARKSLFFFEDRIICLGSDVEDGREQYDTVTVLYQHYLGGDISAENAGGAGTAAENYDVTVTKHPGDASLRLTDPSGNEYVIPAGQRVIVTRGLQESRAQDDGEPTFARYEKAWIDHGKAPRGAEYEYMILLRTKEEEAAAGTSAGRGSKLYQILQKDRFLHAVYDNETEIYAYVFFEAGSAPEESGGTVRGTDTPCLLMERRREEALSLSFCDPDLRLYEGQEADQLDENGNQKEVSLYSRTWLKNDSIGKWSTVILRGNWSPVEDTAEVRVRIKGEETEVSFWGKDGAGREVRLKRGVRAPVTA